jgi:signal transduction histidine kinase
MRRKIIRLTKTGSKFFTIAALIFLIIFGIYHIHGVIQNSGKRFEVIKRLGETAAVLLPGSGSVMTLDAVASDTLKPEYQQLKSMLTSVVRVNRGATFAYIYKVKGGRFFFMADSEPSTSRNCSKAGDVLTEATALDLRMMDPGSVVSTEISSDRWGKWVSVLVPLIDPATGERCAVFGIDFSAREWQRKQLNEIFFAVVIILLSLMALLFILIIGRKSQALLEELEKQKRIEQELLVAKARAEESDRLKTAFLQNISHEIRTPLNSIMGYATLLEEGGVSLENKEFYLRNMVNSGHRLLNTINDIIELSKLQSKQFSVNIVRVSVGEQLYRVHKNFGHAAKEKGLELRCNPTKEDLETYFYSDPELIYSVLQKLLWNALKFTSEGFIEVGYAISEVAIVFFVKDTGIGVDDVQKSFIFEYFRQGDETISRRHEGNGIGLAIARAYVEILGGKIWVEGAPGQGATFSFSLPYHRQYPSGFVADDRAVNS